LILFSLTVEAFEKPEKIKGGKEERGKGAYIRVIKHVAIWSPFRRLVLFQGRSV
jgi:hypothetical protein